MLPRKHSVHLFHIAFQVPSSILAGWEKKTVSRDISGEKNDLTTNKGKCILK